HRALRRRPGRAAVARGRARRGRRHARGRLRAVPRSGGLHPPHVAWPRGDPPRLRAPRPAVAGPPARRVVVARAARAAALVAAMAERGRPTPPATESGSPWSLLDYE